MVSTNSESVRHRFSDVHNCILCVNWSNRYHIVAQAPKSSRPSTLERYFIVTEMLASAFRQFVISVTIKGHFSEYARMWQIWHNRLGN